MDIQQLYTLKSKFVSREVGNDLVLVPLTNNVAQMTEMFTLNETAKLIWQNIAEQTTLEDLEEVMTENFDIDKATAQKDILAFIASINNLLAKK